MEPNQLDNFVEMKGDVPAVSASSEAAWRQWLAKHHAKVKAVWLIIYKKGSGVDSVTYPEAVDQAICYGWIDSKPNKRNEASYYQYFAQRNPASFWSGVNKKKVAKLEAAGQLAPAGIAMINIAKENGGWTALDSLENIELPAELRALFDANPTAYANWETFPKSVKRGILEWILQAKRPETKEKRMKETVDLAAQNKRALFGK